MFYLGHNISHLLLTGSFFAPFEIGSSILHRVNIS